MQGGSTPAAEAAHRRLASLAAQISSAPALTDAAAPLRIHLSRAVAAALSAGRPVVALESTIISHGMPFPANLETARKVESLVREGGATPATIAVLDGMPCVGLEDEQLERLARLGGV